MRPLGDRAFLIGVADAAAGRVLARALDTGARPGRPRWCAAPPRVMVGATDPDADLRSVRAAAEEVLGRAGPVARPTTRSPPGRLVTVPCRFDGPDLDEVAALARCRPDEVAALLTAGPLTAAVVGFSPGFAYLDGPPEPAATACRGGPSPRPVVPAGSVAIANGHAAVYPTASPGGWHLVGRTGFPLFSPERPPYAVLAPGDRGPIHRRRRRRGRRARARWRHRRGPSPAARARSSRSGRRGCAPWSRTVGAGRGRGRRPRRRPGRPGVLRAGQPAGRQPAGAGALELTAGGARLRCVGACHVAVVGAAPEVRVDGAAARGGPAPAARARARCSRWAASAADAAATCRWPAGSSGPSGSASCATDELTGLGAGPLAPGAPAARRARGRLRSGTIWRPAAPPSSRRRAPVELRVLPGPHAEQFEPDALARLAGAVFAVGPESNRVGLRLRPSAGGAWPGAAPQPAAELDSQGVVTGAVQVPPDGDPVDPRCPTTPRSAATRWWRWWWRPTTACSASARPGRRCVWCPSTPGEARRGAGARRARSWRRAVVGHYPLARGLRAGPRQTSSLTAVPTPMTMTTTRSAGAGRARARRGAGVAADEAAGGQQAHGLPGQPAVNEEHDGGDAVDDHGEHGAQPAGVGDGEGQGQAQHGEEHDAHGGAEVAAVDRGGEHPGHQQHRPACAGGPEPRSRARRSTGWAANRAAAPRTSQGTTSSKVAVDVVSRSRAPATPPARATGVRREEPAGLVADLAAEPGGRGQVARPDADGVGDVGGEGRVAEPEQDRERDQAAPAGHPVEDAGTQPAPGGAARHGRRACGATVRDAPPLPRRPASGARARHAAPHGGDTSANSSQAGARFAEVPRFIHEGRGASERGGTVRGIG